MELRVPPHWNIVSRGTGVFGAFVDNTVHPDARTFPVIKNLRERRTDLHPSTRSQIRLLSARRKHVAFVVQHDHQNGKATNSIELRYPAFIFILSSVVWLRRGLAALDLYVARDTRANDGRSVRLHVAMYLLPERLGNPP